MGALGIPLDPGHVAIAVGEGAETAGGIVGELGTGGPRQGIDGAQVAARGIVGEGVAGGPREGYSVIFRSGTTFLLFEKEEYTCAYQHRYRKRHSQGNRGIRHVVNQSSQ